MSTPNSEEGAKLRANAAYSIVQKELDFKETERLFKNFKGIESTSPSQLHDKEFRTLVGISKGAADAAEQINSIVYVTCSAISASSYPLNSSAKVTSVVNSMDNAKQYLKEIESKTSEFKNSIKFDQQKKIITDMQSILGKSITEIRNTINILYQLLFA